MNAFVSGVIALAMSAMSVIPIPQVPAPVQKEPGTGNSPVEALAARVAGTDGNVRDKVARLVAWMTKEFSWTATDYQQRTPEQIIERRGGNCADLARVLARLLDATHVRYRMVREINIQPESESRQANAARKIASGGARFSVFGSRHNDHAWLEVFDPDSGSWFPADPAVGVVGVEQWIRARLALEERLQPAVAAAVPIVQAMLEPIAVVAIGEPREDRSTYYLVDAFDRAYAGKLHALPAWNDWCAAVNEFGPLATRAFAGEVNLHEHGASIVRAANAYDDLRRQANALR
ncbi:MAG: transglutaminase-like domain-containing protein [Bacteroidales bacterium]